MARRSTTHDAPKVQAKPLLTEAVESARAKLNDRLAKGEALRSFQANDAGTLQRLVDQHRIWSDYNETLLKQMFSTDELSRDYQSDTPSPTMYFQGPTFSQQVRDLSGLLDAHMRSLQSILERIDLFAPSTSMPESVPAPSSHDNPKRAFVVHGQDETAKQTVARFLEQLDIEAVILHEQPNRGLTIIEKIERYGDVPFAVVLLTPDDEGRLKGGELRSRARQNVILELGYFVGRLNRERVCALYKGDIELPTDWDGVVWVRMDDRGAWKLDLAREMRAVGFRIDLNTI